MPTGYTADVQDGKVTEFRDFAMQCARAFGACIMMRDDPADAPIPEEFKPSSYHFDRLSEAKLALAEIEAMTDRDAARAADADFTKSHEAWEERIERKRVARERYEAMLAKVGAWSPPTPDHEEMKRFMLSQLSGSIESDCSHSEFDTEPIRQTEAEWKESALEGARHSIDYHERQYAEDVERAARRTAWLKALRKSIANL